MNVKKGNSAKFATQLELVLSDESSIEAIKHVK